MHSADAVTSAICSAAESAPRRCSGDWLSSRTPTLGIPSPIPSPATAQNGYAGQPPSAGSAARAVPASPSASSAAPARSSRSRGRSGNLPCRLEAAAQPSAPTVSGMPAAVAL